MKNIRIVIYLILIVVISCIGSYISYSCSNTNSCNNTALEQAIVQEKMDYNKFDPYIHYKVIYRKIRTGKLGEMEIGLYDYERTNKGDTIYVK